jgi:hypothetical protein
VNLTKGVHMRKIASVSILVFASVGLYSCAGARHMPLAGDMVSQTHMANYSMQVQ